MGLFNLFKRVDLSDYDWYCDECGASLNEQSGFSPYCGTWECTECGYENDISEDNIIDEDDEYYDSDNGEYNSGCAACGNPAYPKCMSSCPMFDD